jgi:hypothetical protein
VFLLPVLVFFLLLLHVLPQRILALFAIALLFVQVAFAPRLFNLALLLSLVLPIVLLKRLHVYHLHVAVSAPTGGTSFLR